MPSSHEMRLTRSISLLRLVFTSIPLTSSGSCQGKAGAAIRVIECRDVDYETAKKEVAGYFQMKGEAYASDASTDLQLDYELVCKIMDDLELEGKMEPVG